MSSEESESDNELKKLSTEVIDLLQSKLEKKWDKKSKEKKEKKVKAFLYT